MKTQLSQETQRVYDARRGVADMVPMLIGYIPFAVVVGTTVAADREPLAAWLATWSIYGGAAQLAVLSGLKAGSPVGLVILAGLVVNARLFIYSASLTGPWRTEPRWRRAIAAALLTDAIWAAAIKRYAEPGTDAQRRRYYLGAAITLWLGWLTMVTAAAVGSRLVFDIDLTLAAPLCLLALIGTALGTVGGRFAAGSAALVGLIGVQWPGGAGLLVAVAVGAAAGLLGDRRAAR